MSVLPSRRTASASLRSDSLSRQAFLDGAADAARRDVVLAVCIPTAAGGDVR